jgi:hypothetical protein
MNNNNKTNFFESVAHHNLERFHSETIAWVFNSFPTIAKSFIKKIHFSQIINVDNITDIKSQAENNQIDITLEYTISGVKYNIFIENKLKATEHKISFKVWTKKLSKLIASDLLKNHINKEIELSQTEYYYLRYKNDFPELNTKFLYLVPNRANLKKKVINSEFIHFYNIEKLNIWNLKCENPWTTITYYDLANLMKKELLLFENNNEQNKIIAEGYINYISSKDFSEFIDLDNFNNNVFGQFEYFKFLFALVKSKLKDTTILNSNSSKGNIIYEYIEPGSSNAGMPLFAFYKRIELSKKYDFFIPKTKIINIGIQIQGVNVKAYVSSDKSVYNDTAIKDINNQVEYKKFVNYILLKLTEKWKYEDKIIFPVKNKGFNSNKTKTFYSRSYKMINFIDTKKIDIKSQRDVYNISDELSEKVNHFVNFDFSQAFFDYEKNI